MPHPIQEGTILILKNQVPNSRLYAIPTPLFPVSGNWFLLRDKKIVFWFQSTQQYIILFFP